ncbi:hypothetical protein Tco_0845046 [Tanacetum coccineum]
MQSCAERDESSQATHLNYSTPTPKHGYSISSLLDMAYWLSGTVFFKFLRLSSKLHAFELNLHQVLREWLKFNNCDFSHDSRKSFKKSLTDLQVREIECPKALDTNEFVTLHGGVAMQNLSQFCHVSFREEGIDRSFTSQAWNRLFRIQEQVIREYVMEFLSSIIFKDHIEELDHEDTLVFQLGGERRSMTMRQFILALGAGPSTTTPSNMLSTSPLVITMTPNIHHPIDLSETLSAVCLDGGVSVDVPWHVAKFLYDKAKGSKKRSPIVGAHLIRRIARYYGLITLRAMRDVTLGPNTSLLNVAKLFELGICRYNGLGIGELVPVIPAVAGEDGGEQANERGVRRHP